MFHDIDSEDWMSNTGVAAGMDAKRRALGRGLESLLGPRPGTVPEIAAGEASGQPLEIALDKIERNPNQTRTAFPSETLDELAASIRATGVVQPIVVRELTQGKYQLITGERRWRASGRAGKTTIPAIVRVVSDEQAMEMTIVENLQRADLNAMEQARAYEKLSREFKMTQEQMASRTGKDRASVGNFLRLLKLPGAVQVLLESGELSFGHGRALLALRTVKEMEGAAAKIVSLAMSVRQTEKYVQSLLNPEEAATREKKLIEPLDPNVREARDLLQRKLGLRVRIQDTRGKGRVIIEYSGVDDFDALLMALGVVG